MNHGNRLRKLNRTAQHRKSMFKNMSASLILQERIKTTLPKAKALRPFFEKLITASVKNPSSLNGALSDKKALQKLKADLSKRYSARLGGYTRIYKLGFRYGDCAPMALIELVSVRGLVSTHVEPSVKNNVASEPAQLNAEWPTGQQSSDGGQAE